MKALRVNFLLLVVSLVLSPILLPPSLLTTAYRAIRGWNNQPASGYLSDSFRAVALAIDRAGNVLCKDFLDMTCLKRAGYPFGNGRETISLVLGMNKHLGTLSRGGLCLAHLLNFIDRDHVELAAGLPIDPTENPIRRFFRKVRVIFSRLKTRLRTLF